MYISEKLKVSDGMAAWVKDFQESDAPQFKGKSDKERKEMAVAAYMAAKKGDINEGVVKTSRYVRAHGKNPKSGYGNWMFTPKPSGDVNWNKEGDEYIQVAGDYKTAKAKAEKWAKDNGHKAVYVMESKDASDPISEKVSDDDWVHINRAGSFNNPKKDTIVGYSKGTNRAPKLKSGANHAMRVKVAKEKGYVIKESVELDESFTDKEIKMAYGILNDPRYKSGNLTKAVDKIEKIKRGLSKHPGVQKAMKATSESLEVSGLSVKENFEDQKHEMALTQAHFIQYAAEEIIEYIEMGGVIEEWYQNKLSKAHSDMESLHSHMEGIKRKNMMGESILPSDKESIVESTGAKFNNAMKQTMGAYDKRDLVKADRYLEKARQYLFSMRSIEYGKIDDESYEQYKKLMKELRNKKIGESSIKEGKGGSGKRLSFVKDQGDNHIVMQLRSAQDLGGMKPIKFRGGKEGRVPKADIDTVLKVHDMLSPEGKRKLRIMISKSPKDFSKAAADLRKAMK